MHVGAREIYRALERRVGGVLASSEPPSVVSWEEGFV
jgi:hypothetical protein